MSSSNKRTNKKKKHCFRLAFNANFTREKALQLAQSTYPDTVFDEVDRAYKRLANEKKFKDKPKRKSETSQKINQTSLEEMPLEIMEKVFEHTSSDDQKTLHETSYGLSSYIENAFKTFKEIRVYVDHETIRTRFNEQKPAVTRHAQIGEKRKLDQDEESVSQESFHNIAELIQHLEKVLNERNLKIDEFSITSAVKRNMEERTSELFSGLQKVFEKMNNKIYVKDLEIAVPTVGFLMSVLEKVKVGHLTHLTIRKAIEDASLDCCALADSPHWPHIRFFSSNDINVTVPLNQVYHMANAFYKNTAITVDEILKIRDRLVKHPKFIYIGISCEQLNTINLLESLKPCLPSKDLSQKDSGVYQCANKWELKFSIHVHSQYFKLHCDKDN